MPAPPAGSCAWQTPCSTLGVLPGVGLVHAVLVHVPLNETMASGGIPFVLKTSSNKWLQNGQNGKDFFFRTQQVREAVAVAVAVAVAGCGGLCLW